ncbi:undecaprenyldiphospho-muramoylpentapeptide beta-N-acetylglucosaminyltransferase [Dokdonella sp.]|uniref:undecaprenyldiphospho-muramoylpentapeptide beta-N-acetylglucosaminyltransferase n=1 Tax=Dokdonella sp. TaxID=2291710 RepID=UPI001B0B3EF6|nr:undecaprenyldiphospho-muramoylpentapeptide beta-N-acetylglucosaminyltransferase [Dokdonella sp.]MBO9665066.1 undecaprenyldiphospho-muramoylpentapeptide beta-N-acetylglucosaminyltransferase [Dokdonella sp.]
MTAPPANVDRPVLIMAGGTGGHIFPGLAVAAELAARQVPVIWLGAHGGLETRLVPQHGVALETLSIGGLRGKGLATALRTPLRLFAAVRAARAVLKRHAPRSVLSMGGYVAAPGGIAARLARIPLVVHEQNRIPGLTNRLLARFAQRVLTGFADVFANAEWVGNPVRAPIAALPAPAERYAVREGALRVLVLGGSQGAASLNAQMPEMLRRRGTRVALQVTHQCGEKHVEKTRAAYAAAGVEAEVLSFVDDMAAAYAEADLAICRAGALTIAELAAAGVPALLVPYPHAVDDHQTRNAEALVAAGAAELVAEGEDFVKRLGTAFDRIADRSTLLAMATAARTLAKPEATRRIADVCLEVAA